MNEYTFKLPCSIGDKIYILSPDKKFFYEAIVLKFEIAQNWIGNKLSVVIYFKNYTKDFPYMSLDKFKEQIKQGFIFQSSKDAEKIVAQERYKERNKMIKIDGKEYQEVYFVWEGLTKHSRIDERKCFETISCVGIFSTKDQAIEGMKKAYSYYKEDNNNIVGELKESQKETHYKDENEKDMPYSFHTFGFDIKYKEGIYSFSECGYSIEKTCLNKTNIFDLTTGIL